MAAPQTNAPRAADAGNNGDSTIISLRSVHKAFEGHQVLEGVSLDIQEGRTTVVIGPSGCGKSVLLKHVVGLLRPDAGEVHFDGQRIDELSEGALVAVRTQFGFLFQMAALFDSMTVEGNICFPLAEHTAMTPAKRQQRCAEVLRMVGMDGTQGQMPAELSGGQRKRVALARAVALHPRVILYDEPTTGLDPVRADVINELIIKLQRELNVTSIAVTHDMASAYKIADRIVMLYDGRLIADGSPEQIQQTDDAVVRHFIQGKANADELAGIAASGSGED